jgi:hypothetical protein
VLSRDEWLERHIVPAGDEAIDGAWAYIGLVMRLGSPISRACRCRCRCRWLTVTSPIKPYREIGQTPAGVRKATMFSGSPSHEKVFRELRERGKKMGADAVIKASYGGEGGARRRRSAALRLDD